MFKIAFYRGTRPGISGLYSRAVRLVTKSIYSHCELIFTDEIAASASFLDGGVRFKNIDFKDDNWDFIELPPSLEKKARNWFTAHDGQKYDLLGNLHFIFPLVDDNKQKWFCSEAIAAALNLKDGWRYDPGTLYSCLSHLSDIWKAETIPTLSLSTMLGKTALGGIDPPA